jgi:membrane protein DedA with SNARE-associated domain
MIVRFVTFAAALCFLTVSSEASELGEHARALTTTLMAWIKSHPGWAMLAIALLAFGESIAFVSLVLPFWGILVALGTAISGVELHIWYAYMTAAAAGAALGDWFSYWLGYHYHERIARLWPFTSHPDLLPRGHQFFDTWGVWAIVIGRFSGPLRASVPIVAGAVQMNKMHFQIANWGSAFLWAGTLLVFGDIISKIWNLGLRYWGY